MKVATPWKDESLGAYLQEIDKAELLDSVEESRLSKRIKEKKEAQKALKKRSLSIDEKQVLKKKVSLGKAASDKMTQSNLRLVVHFAKRFQNQGVPLQDLIQEGNMALMEAVEKYDGSYNRRFSTYASQWILGALKNAVAEQGKLLRIPAHQRSDYAKIRQMSEELAAEAGKQPTAEEVAAKTNISKERVQELMGLNGAPVSLDSLETELDLGSNGNDSSKYMEVMNQVEMREYMIKLISDLKNDKDKALITMRFGLDKKINGGKPMTPEEVAVKMSSSASRIRFREGKILQEMKAKANPEVMKTFLD